MAYQFQLGKLKLPTGASIDTVGGDIELGNAQVDPADLSVDPAKLTNNAELLAIFNGNSSDNADANDDGNIDFNLGQKLFRITIGTGTETAGFTAGTGAGAKKTITYNALPAGGNSLKVSYNSRNYTVNFTAGAGTDATAFPAGANSAASLYLNNHANADSIYTAVVGLFNAELDFKSLSDGGSGDNAGSITIEGMNGSEAMAAFGGDANNALPGTGIASSATAAPDPFIAVVNRTGETIEQLMASIKSVIEQDSGSKSLNTLSAKTATVDVGGDNKSLSIRMSEFNSNSDFLGVTETIGSGLASIAATDYASLNTFMLGTDDAVATATAAEMRTALGVEIGSGVQAHDAQLDQIAALATTDGGIIVGNGAGAFVLESGATARTSLGLAIGSDVQAYDAQLADVAGLTPGDGEFIVGDGSNFTTESGSTARTSLGLGDAATKTVGIGNTNVLAANANVSDNDFLRIDGTSVEGLTAAATMAALSGQAGAAFSMNSNKITNLATPTADADGATKAYVDSVVHGLDVKNSCRVASTGNVTVSGPGNTIDGVTLTSGDRVLLKDQSTGSENGIYLFAGAAAAMTRATDADANAEVTSGLFVFIEEGTANADKGFVLTTNGAITVGSTAIAFTQFSNVGAVTLAGLGGQPLDAELTELATMASNTAAALADLTNTEVALLDTAVAGSIVASKAAVYSTKGRVNMAGLRLKTQRLNMTGDVTLSDNDLANNGNAIILQTNGAARTLTLPAVSNFSGGEIILLKRHPGDTASEILTIEANGSETIESVLNVKLEPGASIQLLADDDGSEFFII